MQSKTEVKIPANANFYRQNQKNIFERKVSIWNPLILSFAVVFLSFIFMLLPAFPAYSQHKVADVKGLVQVKRHEEGGSFEEIGPGDLLSIRDIIFIPEGSSLKVKCDNGAEHTFEPGRRKVSEGCLNTENVPRNSAPKFPTLEGPRANQEL